MCEYCQQDYQQTLSDEGGLTLEIIKEDKKYGIESVFNGKHEHMYTFTKINYCPMCGRKLDEEKA